MSQPMTRFMTADAELAGSDCSVIGRIPGINRRESESLLEPPGNQVRMHIPGIRRVSQIMITLGELQ